MLVGEDADNYYCKDRAEYAQCLKQSGLQEQQDKTDCAYHIQGVAAEAAPSLSASAKSCVLGCLGNGLTLRGCFSSCGLAADVPTQVLDRLVDEQNVCLERVLSNQKQRQENCKR
ncbi:hypothetical protein [Trinickia terrae]|uniref:hypothetical protein n=1 Tax=Trinickia terrae TaxID=2571161 RepID=UPI0010ADD4D9|nr:hypothetical protein [Trinickia terrae]